MKASLERAIEAYRDGELSARRRRKLERLLERDGEAAGYLRASEWVSRCVREAWTEGPPSPPPDRFLAAIRPELQTIDAERPNRARIEPDRPPWWHSIRWVGPLVATAAAGVLVVMLSGVWRAPAEPEPARFTAGMRPEPVQPDPLFEAQAAAHTVEAEPAGDDWDEPPVPTSGSRTGIYDVYQGDAALLIYDGQDDSPLLIFALPDETDGRLAVPATFGEESGEGARP
jgi:anti-sigma factor RsiW